MMKYLALVSFLLVLVNANAETLPKDCFGEYAGEMAAYTVMNNDVELNIEKHDVKIEISAEKINYKSGMIELNGTYTFLKQSGTQYLIKCKLSNGKSVSYDIDLIWNKKAKTLFLSGKNGEPDVTLEKIFVD